MSETTVTKDAANRSLTMERVFDASRDKVWAAWTDSKALAAWWGPRGWETTNKEFNFSVGGHWLYGMKCLDEAQGEWFGQTSWGKATYTDISEPDTFTYKDAFADENGQVDPKMPVMEVTMEFVEQADGQTLVRSISVFETQEAYEQVIAMGVEQGAKETWDRAAEYLEA
jgi:uncharacterized protein YndB with AHSA1/START domain